MPAIDGYAAQGALKAGNAENAQKSERAQTRSEKLPDQAAEAAIGATQRALPDGVGAAVNVTA